MRMLMPSGRSSACTVMTSDLPGSRRSRYCARPSENSTASNWPVSSENITTPILLPVRVLRSCLDVTVPASRPAVAPRFTAAENSVQLCTRIFLSADLYSSSGCADK